VRTRTSNIPCQPIWSGWAGQIGTWKASANVCCMRSGRRRGRDARRGRWGYDIAKEQLFRTLDDVNPDTRLADLEARVMAEANELGVGAMGFGGKVSLIGCKIAAANRLPASFFVSVAYECWAFRRLGIRLDSENGAITKWLYRDPSRPLERMTRGEGFPLTGREIVLTAPLTEEMVRSLKVGDVVLIRGEMYTGRDAVHAYLMKNPPPVDLNGAVLYHCGPVMLEQGGKWTVKAAGPTTSIREEPYQADVIGRYGVRAVIGKGGMGAKTLAALKEHGAVYLNGIGGAAQYYARTVEEVLDVNLIDFGIPEAMWHLRVNNFPAIVTMDAHGNSLHAEVEKETAEELEKLQPA
jgi:fumarate hydratase class I